MLYQWIMIVLILVFGFAYAVAQEESGSLDCESHQDTELDPGRHVLTLKQGDLDRHYIVFVPESYVSGQRMPLVVALHGATMPADDMAQLTGWHYLGENEGFITVYPSGVQRLWNAGMQTDESVAANDDVAFIQAMIDNLKDQLCIQENQIYMSGFSNGAGMVSRLVCELSTPIAAVGVVASGHFPIVETCDETSLVPTIAFFGTADAVVPFEGGVTPIPMVISEFPSVEEGFQSWIALSDCVPTLEEQKIGDAVSLVNYTVCEISHMIDLYVIEGGGHAWPGSSLSIMGFTTQEIDATQLMWEFFVSHQTK